MTETNYQLDVKTYEDFYSNEDVLVEISKQLVNRETTFIGYSRGNEDIKSNDLTGRKEYIFRCIKAFTTEFLKRNMDAFNFFNRNYNIYRSVAILKDMPMFSFKMDQRMEEQSKFNKSFTSYVTGYDFCLDFDGDKIDYNQLWEEVFMIKDLFDDYKVPYSIKASSTKGFHIEIPNEMFTGEYNDKLVFDMRIANSLKSLFSLESLDTTIYNLRRIMKVAYSFDIRTGAVALPLTDKQFEEIRYSKEMLYPENLYDVKNRGLLLRTGNLEKFTKLLDELEEDDLKKNLNQDYEKSLIV